MTTRPITHIMTASGGTPFPPQRPSKDGVPAFAVARVYIQDNTDIILNTVSWTYDSGSPSTWSYHGGVWNECTDLSAWNDSTPNTSFAPDGYDTYNQMYYVDLYVFSGIYDNEFCIILANEAVSPLTTDGWKVRRVEIYNWDYYGDCRYAVNADPQKGQWFRDYDMWAIMDPRGGLITVRRPLAIFETDPVPPTPVLPPYTIRLEFMEEVIPSLDKGTVVQVSTNPNIWDLTYENTDWSDLLSGQGLLLEVIGANTTGVMYMGNMLYSCWNLTTVPLFDTSDVKVMSSMFEGCTALTTIPLFDTSSVTNMQRTFCDCTNVQSGALALYQQASSQATPPTNHNRTFRNCGSNTTTGAAELAQIPSDWKY